MRLFLLSLINKRAKRQRNPIGTQELYTGAFHAHIVYYLFNYFVKCRIILLTIKGRNFRCFVNLRLRGNRYAVNLMLGNSHMVITLNFAKRGHLLHFK